MSNHIEVIYLGKSYFHPDFDLDADSPEDQVRKFAAKEQPSLLEAIVEEIEEILSTRPSEADVQRLWIEQADSYYDPADDGVSYVDWLTIILHIVSDALAERKLT